MTLWRPRPGRVATGVACLLAWLVPSTTLLAATGPDQLAWTSDLNRARVEASRRDRLLWLQFTSPWCHHCDRMEREAFASHPVAVLAEAHFVPVKLPSDQHEALALSFGLSALPATVILRPSGALVARTQGYADPATFTGFLLDAIRAEGRNRPATAHAPKPRTNPESTPLALAGFCPVSLVDRHALVAGLPALTVVHEGRVYRFATAEARQGFLRNPDRYRPVNGGRCPVAAVDRGEQRDGSPRWGVLYGGHLFLCGDDAGRRRFLGQPERYTHVQAAERDFCAHCWAVDGLTGLDRPDLPRVRPIRRDAFPPPTLLEASRVRSAAPRR